MQALAWLGEIVGIIIKQVCWMSSRFSGGIMDNGPFWFGVVVGYITYRTLRHKAETGLGDIAAVIGAVGGAAVLKMFPTGTASFDSYAFGLATGFFVYLIISLLITWAKGPDISRRVLGD